MKLFLSLLCICTLATSFSQWQNLGDPAFSSGQVQYTSLATYGGIPYVAFRDLANANKCTVMSYDGANWNNVGSPGISAGGALYTSLAIDNGYPFVAYVDGSATNKVTVKAFNGSSWLTIGSVGFTGVNTSYVNLKFDGSTPYVAYQDGSNGNKLSVMRFDGVSWIQVGMAGFTPGVASEISMTMIGSTPYVSFKDATVSDHLSVMYFDGITWQYVGGSAGITADEVGKTAIANNGTEIFVAYQDIANSGKLSVLKYNSSWQQVGAVGFSSGAADYIDLECLGADPYVAYQDESYGFRANVMWFDGTDWLELGVPGFSPSQALYTTIAFDGGYPLVAFQDYASGSYKASVMNYEPCFDADVPAISLSENTICQNMPLTLTIDSGNLNSADYWSVYKGSCGGTFIGSFTGSSAVLVATGTTTYYVRGEPHCVTPSSCASVTVAVTPVDSSVSISGATMTAASSGASYQWLNCNTGFSTIAGETNQSFTPTMNGSYALKISENGCTDTSTCYAFSSVDLENWDHEILQVYPNPAKDFLTLSFPSVESNANIQIIDISGRICASEKINGTTSIQFDVRHLTEGFYQIRVITPKGIFHHSVIIRNN